MATPEREGPVDCGGPWMWQPWIQENPHLTVAAPDGGEPPWTVVAHDCSTPLIEVIPLILKWPLVMAITPEVAPEASSQLKKRSP